MTGASLSGIHLYKTARELGFEVSLASSTILPELREKLERAYEGQKINYIPSRWDQKLDYDQYDRLYFDSVVKIVEQENIGLILPNSATNNFDIIADVNEKFNFPGIKPKPARLFREKESYIEVLRQANIPIAKTYQRLGSCETAVDWSKIEFPCICKPSRGSGGVGVYVAYERENLEWFLSYEEDVSQLSEIRKFFIDKNKIGYMRLPYCSGGGGYMIDQWLEGDVVSIAGLIKEDGVEINLIYDIEMCRPPQQVETGFVWPSKFSHLEEKISEVCKQACRALPFPIGPFMMDVIVGRDEKVYVIDLAPRVSSSGEEMLYWIYGKNNFYARNIIKLLTGQEANESAPPNPKPIICRSLPINPGQVREIHYPTTIPDYICETDFCLSPGDRVLSFFSDKRASDRGSFVATGKNIEEAEKNWQNYFSQIHIEMTEA